MMRHILRIQISTHLTVSVIICFLLAVVSSRKIADDGSAATKVKRHATVVSGYGSHRHPLAGRSPIQLPFFNRSISTLKSTLSNSAKLASAHRKKNALLVDDNAPLFIQPVLSKKTKGRSNGDAIRVHCTSRNTTLLVSVAKQPRDPLSKGALEKRPLPISNSLNLTEIHVEESSKHIGNKHESKWIPVEGLFGMYVLPSGFVLVWVVKSESTYKAPPITVSCGETNITRSNWWEIYRVSELHLTHIAFSDNETAYFGSSQQQPQFVFSRTNRLEEERQLNLLRQALKDHEWYYCKAACGIVPDMTRNLQSCVVQLSPNTTTSKTTISPLNCTRNFAGDSIDDQAVIDDCHDSTSKEKPLRQWWSKNSSRHFSRPKSHFFWNELALEPFLKVLTSGDNEMAAASEILLENCIPITSAFCGVQTNLSISDGRTGDSSFRYDQILISRRSRFRAGTRFTRRGADATGAVANFAETEQILVVWSDEQSRSTKELCSVMSYVQTRGSIPLRWSSPTDIKTYRPRVRIGTDPLSQARALQQHLVDQGTKYILFPNDAMSREVGRGNRLRHHAHPSLLLVNLVDKKSDQGRLGRAFDAVLNAVLDVWKDDPKRSLPWLNKSHIQHLWFDFHAEVKSGRWDRLLGLVEEVKPSLVGHDYFAASPSFSEQPKVLSHVPLQIDHLQSGVIRTNCMDCLDRTNVVQSMFGRYVLFRQLADFKSINLPLSYKMAFRKSPLKLPWMSGEVAHRHLWADNADAISRLYAGTPALKGDFTRTGKRTKKGAIDDGVNSLQRYYLNNFLDADRQEGIDLLTGSELFSNVNEYPDEINRGTASFLSREGVKLSIDDAARQVSLDSFNTDDMADSDRDFIRIKYRRDGRIKKSTKGVGFRKPLDLRWLPGDLQSQFRNLILYSNNTSSETFRPSELLQAIDDRAASDLPWWLTSDSSDVD